MSPFGNIEVELSIVVGETVLPLDRILALGRGAVIPLERGVSGPLTVRANGTPVGEARVVLDGEKVNVALLGAVEAD